MALKSLQKGKGYERKIVQILTKRFGFAFHRVPQSGAHIALPGDIFCKNDKWNSQFDAIIECKKTADVIDLVQYAKYSVGSNVLLTKWISQCMRECDVDKKNSFWLIFSWNYGADLIIVGTRFARKWQVCEPVILSVFLSQIVNW